MFRKKCRGNTAVQIFGCFAGKVREKKICATYKMTFRLLHGDCLELMKTLPDASIGLFVCDLPYGCLSKTKTVVNRLENGSGGHASACPWDVKIDLAKFWEQVRRLSANDNTPILHFCNTRFGAELIASAPDWFRHDLVWSKTNAVGFLRANKAPMTSHEMIYVFSKKAPFYRRVDISGNFPAGGGGRSSATFLPIAGMPNLGTTEAGRRCVKSVITVANKKIKGGHPTQKPAELYRWLFERYAPTGGEVLDPTAGSFTSCFVAHSMGINSIGIEKDKAFYDKAAAAVSSSKN